MIRIVTISIVLGFLALNAIGQASEKKALKNIEKKHWEKARQSLDKSLEKDTVNVAARYVLSRYFFIPENPDFDLDAAYLSINKSLRDWTTSSSKQRDRAKKLPLDSLRLVRFREKIDSAIFKRTRDLNTEVAYIEFLEKHPYATDRETALQLRNAVAYLDAVKADTYQAFQKFIEKYPAAQEANDAKSRYNRLLFEAKTKDRRLSSYESFLLEHPETPFRKEIEKDIFELYTLSGEADKFVSFAEQYKDSPFVKRNNDILFHILNDLDDTSLAIFQNDSIANVLQLTEGFLVPIFHDGKFGFMNQTGQQVMRPALDEITPDYICGNITEDILAFPDRLIARNGKLIYQGKVDEMDDLGTGFLKIRSEECTQVLHKSGFTFERCVQDAKVLGKRFIAVLNDGRWAVRSLTGRSIMPERWDEVSVFGNVIAFKKEKQWQLLTFKQLTDFSHEQEFVFRFKVDTLKMLGKNLIWVKTKSAEGVVDQNLNEIVPLEAHQVEPSFFGFVVKNENGFSVADRAGKQSSYFEKVISKEPWLVVRKNLKYYRFDISSQNYRGKSYDSISFDGAFLKTYSRDTLAIHFNDSTFKEFPANVKTVFIPGQDSTAFVAIESDGKKRIFGSNGQELLTVSSSASETFQHAGEKLFIISKKEKKGILGSDGKVVLPVEFDAVGTQVNHCISLLKSMKFGMYDTRSKKLIKPQFDKNIVAYNKKLLIAFKDGRYGFIDWDNKPEGKFDYEEVQYWNDTTALVRRGKTWSLYNFALKKMILQEISDFKIVRANADEKLMIMKANNNYGVMSSSRGRIIPFTFTDLVNVGSAEEPVFFTEKHVAEASIYVVIYYDQTGKMLRREVYEEPDDYEKIYCGEN